jgi:hypothetical protein
MNSPQHQQEVPNKRQHLSTTAALRHLHVCLCRPVSSQHAAHTPNDSAKHLRCTADSDATFK